jgi:AhpD family alkylhydroperoxidase
MIHRIVPRATRPSSPEINPRVPRFTKRSYTFGGFIRDVAIAFRANLAPIVTKTNGDGQYLTSRFTEHVMLAVTAVNKCRYCSWVHSRLALQSGCIRPEIEAILGSDFSNVDKSELVALAFAQHYAETRGKPDRAAARKLLLVYGIERASAIVTSIQDIMIGNLTGNTLDAFQARLRGLHVEGGSPLLEFIVFLIGKPLTRVLKMG